MLNLPQISVTVLIGFSGEHVHVWSSLLTRLGGLSGPVLELQLSALRVFVGICVCSLNGLEGGRCYWWPD